MLRLLSLGSALLALGSSAWGKDAPDPKDIPGFKDGSGFKGEPGFKEGGSNPGAKECSQAIDQTLQTLFPAARDCPASAVPPATAEVTQTLIDAARVTGDSLRETLLELKADLTPIAKTREGFRLQIVDAVNQNPDLLRTMQSVFRAIHPGDPVPERFNSSTLPAETLGWDKDTAGVDLKRQVSGDCSNSGLFYRSSISGTGKPMLVSCFKGEGKLLAEAVDTLAHEALHLLQDQQMDGRAALTCTLHGHHYFSARAAAYSMSPRMRAETTRIEQALKSAENALPAALRERAMAYEQRLSKIEGLFYITPTGDGLQFVPKKPTGVSEEQFWKDIEASLGKGSGSAFGLSIGESQKLDDRIRALGARKGIESYLSDFNSEYLALRGAAVQGGVEKSLQTYFKLLYVDNRVQGHLSRYCDETQANIQTEYRRWRRDELLRAIPGCAKVVRPPGSFDGNEPAAFPRFDGEVERLIARKVSSQYGYEFSPIYGYTGIINKTLKVATPGFDDLFNPKACQK